MRPKLLIFDCDGVLVDSEPLSHRVLVSLLAESGVTLTHDEALSRFLGKSTAQSIDILNDLIGPGRGAEFMLRFKQQMRGVFERELRPVPGIEGALDQLKVPCWVASSGEPEKMRLTLGVTGLLPRFEGRLTSVVEVAHPKPAPDVYLLAAHKAGFAPPDCVVVEDSPTGVAAGVAAGMRVLGYAAVTPGRVLLEAGAHRVFDSMSELPSLLEAL